MKIQSVFLISLLTCSLGLQADVTDDLLFAIEQGDAKEAKRAIDLGANVDLMRNDDGHNARSLAMAKLMESCESSHIGIAGLATALIPVAALINYPAYFAAALATGFAGYKLQGSDSDSKGLIAKLKKSGLGKLMMYGSSLGTFSLAWASSSPYTLVPSAIGTAALATIWYKSFKIQKHFDIYQMVNPEDNLSAA